MSHPILVRLQKARDEQNWCDFDDFQEISVDHCDHSEEQVPCDGFYLYCTGPPIDGTDQCELHQEPRNEDLGIYRDGTREEALFYFTRDSEFAYKGLCTNVIWEALSAKTKGSLCGKLPRTSHYFLQDVDLYCTFPVFMCRECKRSDVDDGGVVEEEKFPIRKSLTEYRKSRVWYTKPQWDALREDTKSSLCSHRPRGKICGAPIHTGNRCILDRWYDPKPVKTATDKLYKDSFDFFVRNVCKELSTPHVNRQDIKNLIDRSGFIGMVLYATKQSILYKKRDSDEVDEIYKHSFKSLAFKIDLMLVEPYVDDRLLEIKNAIDQSDFIKVLDE
jgi:hypothetical protein